MAIDPICKMTVDEKTAKFTSEYKGKKYYFCAPGCKKKFDTDPARVRLSEGSSRESLRPSFPACSFRGVNTGRRYRTHLWRGQ